MKPQTKGFLLGVLITAIVAWFIGKNAVFNANESGYGAGVQNTLGGQST